jgi:hypothetical protein
MLFAKLIVIQPGHATREVLFDNGIVAIGRALDNSIPLEDDSNVSRYHAEIERRADGFWIADLGSSNGTTVNDLPVEFEETLNDGDLIGIGGSTIIEFHLSDVPWTAQRDRTESPAEPPPVAAPIPEQPAETVPDTSGVAGAVASSAQPAPVAPPSTGLSPLLLIGAIGGGLLLTGLVAAVFLIGRSGGCKASVRIVSPQNGTTVRGPLAIRVEAEETECIDRVIYQLDGVKVASSEIAPYQAMLDPADITGLTPGNHVLTVTVEDDNGNRNIQPDEVVLGFEAAQVNASDSNTASTNSGSGSDESATRGTTRSLSAADIKEMCERLAREVSRKEGYIFDRELLHQIEARTGEYAVAGFHNRARPFRDVINDSFINEQGLDPPIGYLVAMSRSNFTLAPDRSGGALQGEGLWRIPPQLAQDAGYIGRCGTATLSDQNQKCAAMVAAAYMKALVVDLFAGDTLYAVTCFGMTTQQAAQWRDHLPADRSDLWKVINSTEQRERLVRFFAAGIVGENPQQFGLMTDTPLSSLYPKK